jgi:hypothetical protein
VELAASELRLLMSYVGIAVIMNDSIEIHFLEDK